MSLTSTALFLKVNICYFEYLRILVLYWYLVNWSIHLLLFLVDLAAGRFWLDRDMFEVGNSHVPNVLF